ncbi:hypothetical protein BGZ60DRAFT_434157 [Tricladium varicosporioides]|nr:hypothetical protein BGZ60DRAFT_434157 [Hymenoscyphus varicosporioides]
MAEEDDLTRLRVLATETFLPKQGIVKEVIAADITRYLGNGALVRPGFYQDPKTGTAIQGYYIEAYKNRALTKAMIEDLKEDSLNWMDQNPHNRRHQISESGSKGCPKKYKATSMVLTRHDHPDPSMLDSGKAMSEGDAAPLQPSWFTEQWINTKSADLSGQPPEDPSQPPKEYEVPTMRYEDWDCREGSCGHSKCMARANTYRKALEAFGDDPPVVPVEEGGNEMKVEHYKFCPCSLNCSK